MLHWFQPYLPLSFPFLVLQRKLCTTRVRHFLRTRVGRLADGITFDLEVERHRKKIGVLTEITLCLTQSYYFCIQHRNTMSKSAH